MTVGSQTTVNDSLEQTQWDYFWIPPDVRAIDRPELLCLCCPRDAPILKTVTRVRAASSDLPRLIDEVSAAHAHVRSRWLVRDEPFTEDLKSQLRNKGYKPAVETHAVAIGVNDYKARAASGVIVKQVQDMQTLRDCVWVIDTTFGESRKSTEAELKNV
jgi:hypothetical protein